MNKWIGFLPLDNIYEMAKMHNLSPSLIGAMVSIESNGNPYATRYESDYRYLVDIERFAKLSNISFQTEVIHQKTSWGLMQVMGGVAREHFFKESLTSLVKPKRSLHIGCLHYKKFLMQHENESDAISAYNQGGPYKTERGEYKNQWYVNAVLKRKKELQDLIYG